MDSRRASAIPPTGNPESFCSQEVSIKIQGAYHYLRHPQQDIYLAAIYGRDFSFCGDPAKAPSMPLELKANPRARTRWFEGGWPACA
jgi:hypothetical protein